MIRSVIGRGLLLALVAMVAAVYFSGSSDGNQCCSVLDRAPSSQQVLTNPDFNMVGLGFNASAEPRNIFPNLPASQDPQASLATADSLRSMLGVRICCGNTGFESAGPEIRGYRSKFGQNFPEACNMLRAYNYCDTDAWMAAWSSLYPGVTRADLEGVRAELLAVEQRDQAFNCSGPRDLRVALACETTQRVMP